MYYKYKGNCFDKYKGNKYYKYKNKRCYKVHKFKMGFAILHRHRFFSFWRVKAVHEKGGGELLSFGGVTDSLVRETSTAYLLGSTLSE
ncbi:hypothetical protein CEXT_129761 [Caerostris extrusa]|uniref:Uncharacterized protein n=1 Tax=Caerostris extrusa TaxID=172846 RepID=A0AAV4P2G6_CAEEX|nr:hypothetical protein CEXT_129761 [Caerostris extrusa]